MLRGRLFGGMYDLQGQGIPFILPIKQGLVIEAVQNDRKLKRPLYQDFRIRCGAFEKNDNRRNKPWNSKRLYV